MSPTAFRRLLSGVRSSPRSAPAGPRANGMAVIGSKDDDDEPKVPDFDDSKVDDFPPGAPGAEEEEEAPGSDVLGSCGRFVGDVLDSGGADNRPSLTAAESL